MSYLVENALKSKGKAIQGAVITVLGAAYLENADDTRNTPAAALVGSLIAKGADVRIHDPYVTSWEFGPHTIEQDFEKAVTGADCIALVTKHREYLSLDLDDLKRKMQTPVIVDGRNVFDQKLVEEKGFEFRGVGKAGIRRD